MYDFLVDTWHQSAINSLSANFTKWSNTLKQFVGNLPTNCLSVFDHFVGLTLKGLTSYWTSGVYFTKGYGNVPYPKLFQSKRRLFEKIAN